MEDFSEKELKTETRKSNRIVCIILGVTVFLIAIIAVIRILRVPKTELSFDSAALLERFDTDERLYETGAVRLSQGVYDISVFYQTSAEAAMYVSYKQISHNTVLADQISLSPNKRQETNRIWVNDNCERFKVLVKDYGEDLSLDRITIETADVSKIYGIAKVFAWVLLGAGIFLLYLKWEQAKNYLFVSIGILIITLISSLPLFARYITPGHDLFFHLLRVDGVRDALLSGAIPPKVQTNWNNGWGYAISATYGDLPLILPVFMRLIGCTMQTAYKAFVFTLNALTAVVSFLCFMRITKDRRVTALLFSFLYTCAPYRLCCIYIRGALGEYTGTLFLPVILLFMLRLLFDPIDDDEYGTKLYLPVFALTGLIQTHILSCVMVAVFGAVLFMIFGERVCRRQTLLAMGKIAFWTVLLNLGFLVPLLEFLQEPLEVKHANGYVPDFQHYGVTLAELFAQRSSGSPGFNWSDISSLGDRMSMPLGNGFVLMTVVFFMVLAGGFAGREVVAKVKTSPVGVLFLLGFLAAFMATNIFPYDRIETLLPFISKMLTRVNLPYRYLTMAILFFAFAGAYAFTLIEKPLGKFFAPLLLAALLLTGADQSMDHVCQTLYSGAVSTCYDTTKFDDCNLIGYEFLYDGSETACCTQEIRAKNCSLKLVSRDKNRFELNVESAGKSAFAELPLFYYPGYRAEDQNGNELEIRRGSNNCIKVMLKKDFTGTFKVYYKEKAVWRIAELISLLSFGVLAWLILRERKKNHAGCERA